MAAVSHLLPARFSFASLSRIDYSRLMLSGMYMDFCCKKRENFSRNKTATCALWFNGMTVEAQISKHVTSEVVVLSM